MRVLKRTEHELILEERAILLRLFGAIFFLPGFLLLLKVGDEIGGETLVMLFGAAVILLPPIIRIQFHRPLDLVTIGHKSLLGRSARQFPVSAIQGVEVDPGSDPDGTYRVRLLLPNGEKVPLTPWFQGWKRGNEKIATTIREWIAGR